MNNWRRGQFNVLRLFAWLGLMATPSTVLAHEAYVLPQEVWKQGWQAESINVWQSLSQPTNLAYLIGGGLVLVGLILAALYFWQTRLGRQIESWLGQYLPYGKLILRIAIALALVIGVQQQALFGPELSLEPIPYSEIIHWVIYSLALLLVLGWMTELTALAGIIIYGFAFMEYGPYVFHYLTFLAAFVVLLFFGAGPHSVDHRLHPPKKERSTLSVEALLLRIGIGISLLVAGVWIKLMHAPIALEVVQRYELTTANWLMPRDPNFFVLLVGLTELFLAVAFLFGFQTRLLALVFLKMLLVAQIYFREPVWPHFILYGMMAYLILTDGGKLTLDQRFKTRLFVQWLLRQRKVGS